MAPPDLVLVLYYACVIGCFTSVVVETEVASSRREVVSSIPNVCFFLNIYNAF